MNKLRTFVITIISSLTLLLPAIAAPVLVHADSTTIKNGLGCGTQLQFSTQACQDQGPQAETTINHIITLIINIFSVVVGLIAVIMIIIGGIRFVLSGGDSAATGNARNTVLYAVVGLVVVALAQILVRYVLNRVNGATSSAG